MYDNGQSALLLGAGIHHQDMLSRLDHICFEFPKVRSRGGRHFGKLIEWPSQHTSAEQDEPLARISTFAFPSDLQSDVCRRSRATLTLLPAWACMQLVMTTMGIRVNDLRWPIEQSKVRGKEKVQDACQRFGVRSCKLTDAGKDGLSWDTKGSLYDGKRQSRKKS